MREVAHGVDSMSVTKRDDPKVWVPPKGVSINIDEETGELKGRLQGKFSVAKYADDEKTELIEVVEGTNLFLTSGITELWRLVYGNSANTFSNAQARIGVGDSATAPGAAQTDLQAATNKLYNAMNASYPQMSGKDILFQADFTSGQANWAWNEMVIKQNTSSICLNRSTNSGSGWGTKSTGTWTATATLSIS